MTAIFYGSTTGNTEALANEIAKKLSVSHGDVFDVGGVKADKTDSYDTLLLGSSTWGLGELQDDWYDFLDALKAKDLSGKKVAFFGCGDSDSYPDTFCDAMGLIREGLESTGCSFVGVMDADDYSVKESKAFNGDRVIGLAADDGQEDKTPARLERWAAAING